MEHAICLVGATLTQPKIDSLVASLGERGLNLQGSRWLNPGQALDLYVNLDVAADPNMVPKLTTSIRQALPSIDVAVVPVAGRAKALMVADMDSTLVVGETIVEMARAHGVEQAVSRLTDQAMRGKLDFTAALIDRMALLKGLALDDVMKVAQNMPLSPGRKPFAAPWRPMARAWLSYQGALQWPAPFWPSVWACITMWPISWPMLMGF